MLFINKNTQKMKNAVDQQKIKKKCEVYYHAWLRSNRFKF